MSSYIVSLAITTTVYVYVDGGKRKDASTTAKEMLASDEYKSMKIVWIGDDQAITPSFRTFNPTCTEIVELDEILEADD